MSEYDNMTVAELKELLKDAGLPVSGKKADLIARLEEAEVHDDNVEEEIVDEEDDDFDDYDDDEDWDDDEEYFHVAQKPVLDEATKSALEARKAQRKETAQVPPTGVVPIPPSVSNGMAQTQRSAIQSKTEPQISQPHGPCRLR